MLQKEIKHIVISRIDAIGDVVLTLPIAGFIRAIYPNCRITFLCSAYTLSVVELSEYIDDIIIWDSSNPDQLTSFLVQQGVDSFLHVFPNKAIAKASKKAKISYNIGTRNRWFHWLYLNQLVPLSRRNSDLHEAQLNIQLFAEWHKLPIPSFEAIQNWHALEHIGVKEKRIILHPSSNGSAREWAWSKYEKLIAMIVEAHPEYTILISGTAKDANRLQIDPKSLPPQVELGFGQYTLAEFIKIIANSRAMIAASTGPLHIASALGIQALGVYPSRKPMYPQRWKPIGKKAKVFTEYLNCSDCGTYCACMDKVEVLDVFKELKF